MQSQYEFIDHVFGSWKVLYKCDKKDTYHCKCIDCNTVEKDIRGWTLRNRPPACNCKASGGINKDILSQNQIEAQYVNCDGYTKLGARAHNLYGRTFGYWKVLYYVGDRKWRCQCTCGCRIISDVTGYSLESGASKGHNKSALKNEKDNTYDKLKVLDYDETLKKWRCQCTCGNIVYAAGKSLRNGDITSCGKCYKGTNLKDRVFGEWKVLYYVGDHKWHCRCSCGTERDVLGQNLINGRSISCGCKSGEKRAQSFRTTMMDRYGELASQRAQTPREQWQVETVNNPEKLKNYIEMFIEKYKRKPHVIELSEHLDTTYSALVKHINAYGLRDMCLFYDNFSIKENELLEYIKSIYSGNVETRCRDIIKGQEIDIYLPELKIGIEFNGVYWHGDNRKDKWYHRNKSTACYKLGIQLVHIYEYEWDERKDLIKAYLKDLMHNKQMIYARNCEICKISEPLSIKFLNENHLQGYVNGSDINLGLVTELDGIKQVVAIMTFGKPRFNKNYKYELLRFTNKSEITVTGGAAKLFKCFLDNTSGNIISYCNMDKFNGKIYEALGFKLDHISDPNYVWIKPDGTAIPRYKTMKSKLIQQGLGSADMTEDEIMRGLKCYKLYDSGNYVFTYNREEGGN